MLPLVNPHCPLPWHCCHVPAESKPPFHVHFALLSKVECSPTAHQLTETQWNVMGLEYILVVHHINCTCADNITEQEFHYSVTINKEVSQFKYKSACLLCPCSWCAQRGHKRQTSSKQCRPTLSTAFTSNSQDRTRYSTMDNWPFPAAQCKAVSPLSPESKRWPSILGARYWATARLPPAAHKWKALRPSCIEQCERACNNHHQVHPAGWRSSCISRHIIEICTKATYAWCDNHIHMWKWRKLRQQPWACRLLN